MRHLVLFAATGGLPLAQPLRAAIPPTNTVITASTAGNSCPIAAAGILAQIT